VGSHVQPRSVALALREKQPTAYVSGGLFVVLGMSTGALGVAWPSVGTTVDLSLQDLAGPLAVSTASYSALSIATGRLLHRAGPPPLLGIGIAAAAAGLLLALVPGSLTPMFTLAVGLVGGGSGIINAAVNVHATLEGGPRRPAYLHALWAVGAMTGPGLIAAVLATVHRWQYAFIALVGAFIVAAIGVLRTRKGWSLTMSRRQWPGWTLLSRPDMLCAVALPFAYVGLEVSTGHWAFLQLLSSHLSWTSASIAVTLFWMTLLGGRLLLVLVAGWLTPPAVLNASVIATFLGALTFWLWTKPFVALLMLPVMGFGLSVVLPAMFQLTRERLGHDHAVPVIACQVAAGTLGGLLCPTLIGVLMRWQGLDELKPCLFALAVFMGLLYVGATRLRPEAAFTPTRD
jgi:fucose permease